MNSFEKWLNEVFYDQYYSDSDGEWKVIDIYDYVKKIKLTISTIDVKELLNNLEPSENEICDELPGSPEFIDRSNKSDLNFPIMVVKYIDGNWICDGVHRLWKVVANGGKSIKAYIITKEQLDKIIHKRKK